MKFGQKVFIISFILIILTINIIGYLMITNVHKKNIDIEIERAIEKQNNITNSIYYNLSTYDSKLSAQVIDIDKDYLASEESFISYVVSNIASQYLKEKRTYIELYKSSDELSILYSNFLISTNDIFEKIKPNPLEITTYITDVNDSETLFVSSIISLEDYGLEYDYILISTTDISDIYANKDELVSSFRSVSIIASFTIPIILYICIYFLTRKINKLETAVKEISDGNYSIQISKLGNDEIDNLGKSVNKMTESINKNIEEIKTLSENRQNFINDITHEIRTPLTSIIGFSNLLSNMKIQNEDTIAEYSNRIYEEGTYLKNISDKLLEIALLENNKIQIQEENISSIVEEACVSLEDILFSKGITLVKHIKPDVVRKVDKDLIKSLLINIINNAAKAYDTTGIIEIYLLEDSTIKIIDFGKGISKEELKKIKEPFYIIDKSRTRNKSGLGLGLSLCQKICELHNAKLIINSEFGNGTEIIINFKGGIDE